MHKCVMYDCREASLPGPKVSQEEFASDRKEKQENKRTAHPLKYLHLEVYIKKRISLYHPDWVFSIKAEIASFRLAQQSGAEQRTGCPGCGPEPRRLPVDELARGREGKMPVPWSLQAQFVRKGSRSGAPHTLPCCSDYVLQQMEGQIK